MGIDVTRARERDRRRRLFKIAAILTPVAAWLWIRILQGNPVSPGLPDLPDEFIFFLPMVIILLLIAAVVIIPMLGNGRSPHVIYLPEQIDVGFDDVKGLGAVLGEVRHTLDVFLNHRKFRTEMGGRPRRGVLSKDHRERGRPTSPSVWV
ncbi:MAG: hypothetical protein KJN71_03625 [Acidimicrobiia bacterium]|nr:hypothetical protein [Acidimicrobiia bacterium]